MVFRASSCIFSCGFVLLCSPQPFPSNPNPIPWIFLWINKELWLGGNLGSLLPQSLQIPDPAPVSLDLCWPSSSSTPRLPFFFFFFGQLPVFPFFWGATPSFPIFFGQLSVFQFLGSSQIPIFSGKLPDSCILGTPSPSSAL